jgi:hypothetical protein
MKVYFKLLNELIIDVELKQGMYFTEPNYRSLSSFLLGCLVTIENIYSTSISKEFSDWLNATGQKTSLFWTEYILIIDANGDEELAYDILLKKIKAFIQENTTT